MDDKVFNESLDKAVENYEECQKNKRGLKHYNETITIIKVIEQNATEEQKAIAAKRMKEVMAND